MKVRIEVDPSLTEDEVVIRCRRVEEHILRLSQEASESGEEKSCMALRIGETSYYVPLKEILFFETVKRKGNRYGRIRRKKCTRRIISCISWKRACRAILCGFQNQRS